MNNENVNSLLKELNNLLSIHETTVSKDYEMILIIDENKGIE